MPHVRTIIQIFPAALKRAKQTGIQTRILRIWVTRKAWPLLAISTAFAALRATHSTKLSFSPTTFCISRQAETFDLLWSRLCALPW